MIASRDEGASPDPESAMERTAEWLLERQHDEGYWVGELEGDTILESEYILLMAFLGRERTSLRWAARVTSWISSCATAAGRSIPAARPR